MNNLNEIYKMLDWRSDFGEQLKAPFIESFISASQLKDEEGLRWLDYLSELLDNAELKEELPKSIVERLDKHYKNWGFWYQE